MMKNSVVLLALGLLSSCGFQKNNNEEVDLRNGNNKPLEITFFYENGSDSVIYNEETNLVIEFSNTQYDSLLFFIGTTDGAKLLDTLTIVPVIENRASLIFLPSNLGQNTIEGVVKQFDDQGDKTIVKTTPYKTEYFVVEAQ